MSTYKGNLITSVQAARQEGPWGTLCK